MRAVLHHGPESYVSHDDGARTLGCTRIQSPNASTCCPVEPHHRRSTPVGVVHSTTDLFDSQITSLQGVPIVTPIRAIFDIAGRTHPMRVERALDNAWARRLVTYAPAPSHARGARRSRSTRHSPPSSAGARSDHPTIDHLTATRRTDSRRSSNGPVNVPCVVRSTSGPRRIGLAGSTSSMTTLPFSVEIQSEFFHGSVLDRRRDEERIARAARRAVSDVLEVWEINRVAQSRPGRAATCANARRRRCGLDCREVGSDPVAMATGSKPGSAVGWAQEAARSTSAGLSTRTAPSTISDSAGATSWGMPTT